MQVREIIQAASIQAENIQTASIQASYNFQVPVTEAAKAAKAAVDQANSLNLNRATAGQYNLNNPAVLEQFYIKQRTGLNVFIAGEPPFIANEAPSIVREGSFNELPSIAKEAPPIVREGSFNELPAIAKEAPSIVREGSFNEVPFNERDARVTAKVHDKFGIQYY